MSAYTGRFAPTPSGPLHAGSVVAALASWLDARAHGGRWLVRIEDTDLPRCPAGADEHILHQLQALGLSADLPVVWQSQRGSLYERALERLLGQSAVYGCACSRAEIEAALERQGSSRARHAATVYPGTCRLGTGGRTPRAWRVRCGEPQTPLFVHWADRRLGPQVQDLSNEVGDFVLRRADGLWAYQLAVVVDDHDQGITHVVRGEDLADNTPRQMHLQALLGMKSPQYLHTPLVLAPDGLKLSKQNGAQPVDIGRPQAVLIAAALTLDLQVLAGPEASPAELLAHWVEQWRARWSS